MMRKKKDGQCRNKISKQRNEHFLYIILIFIISLTVLFPFLKRPYAVGHDTKFHLANILSLEEQISKRGMPTSPILSKIGYGLGYGSQLFYPPLSHTVTAYISSGLSYFHLTVVQALKLVHLLVLFLSGITMYFLSHQLSKNKKVALFSAIIYMTFPYHISDIYVRDALAECFIFLFLPMIFSGIYELLEENKTRFYPLFIVGYVGGLLSHFTIMIYFTILLALFLLISRKKVFQKEFLVPFGTACFSVLGITAFFLSGLLENKFLGNYVVFEPGEMTKRIVKTALYPFEYLNIIPTLQSRLKFYFPIILLVLIGITFYRRKNIKFPKYSSSFLLFGLVAFLCSTKLFPWQWIPYSFQMIQFPWRFEIFVGLIVSLFAPLCLKNIKWKKSGVLILIFLFSAYVAMATPSEEKVDLNNIWWNGGMGWQKEYLPIEAKKNKDYIKKKKQSISFFSGNGSSQVLENNISNLKFHLELNQPSTIELPRIYYPGYQLINENNEQISLKQNKFGLLQADVLKSGNYVLQYTGTTLRNFTIVISVVTIILSISIYFYHYKKRYWG